MVRMNKKNSLLTARYHLIGQITMLHVLYRKLTFDSISQPCFNCNLSKEPGSGEGAQSSYTQAMDWNYEM